jgi:hypothetical protein
MDSQQGALQFGLALGSALNWSASNQSHENSSHDEAAAATYGLRSRSMSSASESLNRSRSATESGRSANSQIGKIDLAAINENVEESAVLEDLEMNNRKAAEGLKQLHEFEAQGNTSQNDDDGAIKNPSGVTAADLRARLSKAASVRDTTDYAQFRPEFGGIGVNGGTKMMRNLRKTLRFLFPDLGRRINIYLAVIFLLFVTYTARKISHARKMFTLFGVTALLELACSVLDRISYKLIDKAFTTHFNVAYQLHALNGPFGFIIAVTIMRGSWYKFDAPSLVPLWDTFLTAAAAFIICLAAKNWTSRRQYVYLLEKRFTDKVEGLNTKVIILSELASTRPPRTRTLRRTVSSDTAGTSSSAGTYSAFAENTAVQGALRGGRNLAGKVRISLSASLRPPVHYRSAYHCKCACRAGA